MIKIMLMQSQTFHRVVRKLHKAHACCCALFVLFLALSARADDSFDTALDKLVTETTKAVAESGNKKVVVLDFTDIAGGMSAFGKFLAEQLSVGLVTAKKEFTVVDRAHLRSILAEHKLTEEGLVKPENAKKLGEFSGVDALVIGTITSVNSGHLITVKVITTEKAELAAATKAKLPLNPDFDTVLRTDVGPTMGKGGTTGSAAKAPSPREFRSEYFNAKFSRLQVLKNGEILVSVDLLKANPGQQVALNIAGYSLYAWGMSQTEILKMLRGMPAVLRASTGEEYRLCNIEGISVYNKGWQTQGPGLSDKQPTIMTLRFRTTEGPKSVISATTTFTFGCAIEAVVRDDPERDYREMGTINVHFRDVR